MAHPGQPGDSRISGERSISSDMEVSLDDSPVAPKKMAVPGQPGDSRFSGERSASPDREDLLDGEPAAPKKTAVPGQPGAAPISGVSASSDEQSLLEDLVEKEPEDNHALLMVDYMNIIQTEKKKGYKALRKRIRGWWGDGCAVLYIRNAMKFLLEEFEPNVTHTDDKLSNPEFLLKRLKEILENYEKKFRLFDHAKEILDGSLLSAAIARSQSKVSDLVYQLVSKIQDYVRLQGMYLQIEQECIEEISDLLEKERQLIAALKEVSWDAPQDGEIVKAARNFVETGKNLTTSCSEDLDEERIRKDNLIQEIIRLTNEESRFQDNRRKEFHLATKDKENKEKLYTKLRWYIEQRLQSTLDNPSEISEIVNIWIMEIDNVFQPNAQLIMDFMHNVPLAHTESARLYSLILEDKEKYETLRQDLNNANRGTEVRGDTYRRKEQELQRIIESIMDLDIAISTVIEEIKKALPHFSASPVAPVRPISPIRPESSPPPRASSPKYLRAPPTPTTPPGVVGAGNIGFRDLQYIDEDLSPEIFRKGSPEYFPRSDPLTSSPISLDSTPSFEQPSFSHSLPSPIDIRIPGTSMRYDESVISPIPEPSHLPFDSTFDESSRPPMDRTFELSPVPARDRTFDASSRPLMDRTFEAPGAFLMDRTFEAPGAFLMDRTFEVPGVPARDRTFDASSRLPMGGPFEAPGVPLMDRTFEVPGVPARDRTFDASSSPPRSVVPQDKLYTPNQFVTPPISKLSRFGYTDPTARVLNIPPGADLDIPTPFKQSLLLTSPKGKPLLLDIDVDPKPLIETRSGEHFICDISLDLRDPGQQKRDITPVYTYGRPPEETPTDTRRYGLFTPRGIFKKRHYNVRRIYVPEEYQSPNLPWSPTYLPEDARLPISPFPPSPDYSDRSISREKSPDRVMNRTFAPSSSRAMDRTFEVPPGSAMDRTFDASPRPPMDRTFEVPGVPGMDRTFDASPRPPMDRTFEVPRVPAIDRTFDASPRPPMDRTFEVPGVPAMNRTFDASPRLPMNRTFEAPGVSHTDRSFDVPGVPAMNGTFDASSRPPMNRTFGVSPVPARDRQFDESLSPSIDRTFDESPVFFQDKRFDASSPYTLNKSFTRSPAPARDRTFDASSNYSSERSFNRSPASSRDRTFDASSNYSSDRSFKRSPASSRDRTFDASSKHSSDRSLTSSPVHSRDTTFE